MIKKIMIKYDVVPLSEIDNYVNSIIKSSSNYNQMVGKTEFITDSVINFSYESNINKTINV